MKRLALLVCLLLMVGFAQAAGEIQYRFSGPWQNVSDGTSPGWIGGAVPNTTATAGIARAGGAGDSAGSEVTLDNTVSVYRIQAATGGSGTFHILNGGILNMVAPTDGAVIGNSGGTGYTGTLTVDTGGTLNVNTAYMRIGYNANGVANVSGTVNLLGANSHLWMGAGSTLGVTGTLNINNGGIFNVGGNFGMGRSSDTAITNEFAFLNVNSGGLLNLNRWNDTGAIVAGSVLTINEGGVVKIGGNRVTAANNFFTAGKIATNYAGGITATWDSVANVTTIIPEPATMVLLGLGGLLLRKRR